MTEWIDVEITAPKWGEKILVYRGKIDLPEAYRFDLPPLFEVTRKYCSAVTHWKPIYPLPNYKPRDQAYKEWEERLTKALDEENR